LSDFGAMLPALYQLDRVNGWSIGMRAVTQALLDRVSLPAGPILELGCGSGVFNAELQRRYPHRPVLGVDLHPLALAYAREAGREPPALVRADLQRLPFEPESVSAIFALDTFDQHGVDLHAALSESWRILRPQGMLLLRVSAHPWLEGEHDMAFNTGRRYQRAEVLHALERTGFVAERVTFANALLSPPLVVIRLLQRWGGLALDDTSFADSPVNGLFARVLTLEAQWLRQANFGFGISLYVMARK
jgi:SAM-dependent methyltransferase